MPLSTAAVIRHVAFEDLGVLAPVLAARGISARYFDAGVDDLGAWPALASSKARSRVVVSWRMGC